MHDAPRPLAEPATDDQMQELKLPWPVRIGQSQFGKGVSLLTLINAARRYKQWAMDGAPQHEDQATIGQWARDTFGEVGNVASIAARANKEMAELVAAAVQGESPEKVAEEAADVIIVLMRVFDYTGTDWREQIDRKMAINRTRKWDLDGYGHGYHRKTELSPLEVRPGTVISVDPAKVRDSTSFIWPAPTCPHGKIVGCAECDATPVARYESPCPTCANLVDAGDCPDCAGLRIVQHDKADPLPRLRRRAAQLYERLEGRRRHP